ncbi:hypothetical protein P8631_23380, partial [Guyparkeria sp. 1SP6A2]|nr:hypothetical protein [Guyparkeria sp. 1SP6A2]
SALADYSHCASAMLYTVTSDTLFRKTFLPSPTAIVRQLCYTPLFRIIILYLKKGIIGTNFLPIRPQD